jgi:bacillopeptidase F
MRIFATVLIVLLAACTASAEKPSFETEQQPARIPCGLNTIFYDWDFATGPHDFTTSECDDQGVPVWELGATTYIADAPGDVWGTVLEGDYPTDAGEALVSPPFEVTADTYLMEVVHYYAAENLWDGGNVKVDGEVITPVVGYPGVISVPGDWYAWCVDFQWGFTGLDSGWLASCFDLSAYIGQTIQVSFEFGSDDTFTEAGWYIASIKVGTDQVVTTEAQTWSGAKSVYR